MRKLSIENCIGEYPLFVTDLNIMAQIVKHTHYRRQSMIGMRISCDMPLNSEFSDVIFDIAIENTPKIMRSMPIMCFVASFSL